MHLVAILLSITGHLAIGHSSAPAPAERARTGLWIADTAFSPGDIASAEQSFNPEYAQPNVLITFTEPGRVKFERVQQGRVEQLLEISVDGEVVASPFLREAIIGNQITIDGNFTVEEAKALARRIVPPRRP